VSVASALVDITVVVTPQIGDYNLNENHLGKGIATPSSNPVFIIRSSHELQCLAF
jgi:hypothetical protein